jgi:hypothetical protein
MVIEPIPEEKDQATLDYEALLRGFNWLLSRQDMEIDGRHVFEIIQQDGKAQGFVSQDQYDRWVESLIQQTPYYKNFGKGKFSKDAQWNDGETGSGWSGRRRALVKTQEQLIRDELLNLGLEWSDGEILAAAKYAWEQDMGEAEIRRYLATDIKTPISFGEDVEGGTTQADLRTTILGIYDNYLIDPDDNVINEWARRAYIGNEQEQLDLLRSLLGEQAEDLYPAVAERIRAGRSPLDILGSYGSVFYSIMGYQPQWKNEHRKLALDILSGDQKDDGAYTPLTANSFAYRVRTSEEADYNPNIFNETMSFVNQIGSLMGQTTRI